MSEHNGGTVHSKGSSTLKQKIKKKLGSSPTVSRKGSHASAFSAVDGRSTVRVKLPDQRELETSEKSVNAAIQYMNIYCSQELEKDDQIPHLTEAIVGEVKKLLDVAEILIRGAKSPELDAARSLAASQREDLLRALASLVRWADKLYMSEERSTESTDPSSHLSPLSLAVKCLVQRVQAIYECRKEEERSSDSRLRHRSVPNVALQLHSPESSTPPSPMEPTAGLTASYSAENLTETESHRKGNRIPISGSDGHLSLLTHRNHSPPAIIAAKKQQQTSPLAQRRVESNFTFNNEPLADSGADDSSSEVTSLSLSSHVAEEDDEEKPPLPPKKRHSFGLPETPTLHSEFFPLYADDRVKVPADDSRPTTVLPSKYTIRRPHASDLIPKGPMKATHPLVGAPPNGLKLTSSGINDNIQSPTVEYQQFPRPFDLESLSLEQVPLKKPPKPPRQPSFSQEQPFDAMSISSDGRSSYFSDVASPPPILPVQTELPLSPPPKPPRTPSTPQVRPPKPPRPSTPVQLPLDEEEPPPLPVKQKRTVADYNALFGTYQGADEEYNSPLFISRPDSSVDVAKQQIAFGLEAVPRHPRESQHLTGAGDVVPPLPEKRNRKVRDRSMSHGSCYVESEEEGDMTMDKRSKSDPNILESKSSGGDDATDATDAADGNKLGVPDSPIYSKNVKDLLLFNEEEGGGASLKGGTVDALIAYAATASASGPDRLYYEAFLMTYRTFVSSETVVEKLLERHDFFLGRRNAVVCNHTLSVLMRVVDDLRGEVNKELLDRLVDVVYRLLCDGELKLATILRRSLIQKWKHLHEPRVSPVQYLMTKPDTHARQRKLTDLKSRLIAEQMSLLDFKFFQNIETPEMLAWAEEQNEEKNRTLTAFTEHFNNVSGWCRTRLIENSDAREREKVAQKLVKVMRHLREINNFNSYLAILSAFDAAAISRLEWSDEVLKGLNEPHSLIDNKASFKAYRTALKGAKMPCIPYLGLFLQDLTFLHLGNPSYFGDDKKFVSFNKRWRQFTVLEKIRKCQQTEYPFQRDEVIIRVFNGFEPYLGEEQLYQRSLKIKQRQF